LGGVRREVIQRLSAVLYGTLASYLRDSLQEGIVLMLLLAFQSRGLKLVGFWSFVDFHFLLVVFITFSCKHFLNLEI
jgi:hypothetical protein